MRLIHHLLLLLAFSVLAFVDRVIQWAKRRRDYDDWYNV